MNGKSLAMLPWYPGDFMTATRGWSVTARGVYRELLDAQWDMGALPSDHEELRTLINATVAEWRTGWAKCEPKFPLGEDGMRRNPRLESHRLRSVKLTEAKRYGAAITNAKRHAERSDSDTLSDTLNGTDSERTASQTARASISVSISDPSPSRIQSPTPYPRPQGRGRVGGGEKAPEPRIPTADELEALEREREAQGEVIARA